MTSAESVDGSAMMTSAVMSSQSAVSYSTTNQWYLKLAIAKRCPDAPLGPVGLPEEPAKANTDQSSPRREIKRGKISVRRASIKQQSYQTCNISNVQCMMLPRIIDKQGTTTQLYNKISIDHQIPNHSDSAGNHDSATALDSQNGDLASKSRLGDYRVSKKQAQYAIHECQAESHENKAPTASARLLPSQLTTKLNRSCPNNHAAKTYSATQRQLGDNFNRIELGATNSPRSERYNYVAPTRQADPRLQSGTKRMVLERGTWRHQPCSKPRLKSTAIGRTRVRLNNEAETGIEGLES
ncbi:Cysteine-rich receptor-like protein kinase [Dorcoceras hygrometricum]|uniref:Cysteine-rich receptor-like protein kinase n=1 Tax=Dorcoceras hygrometricum TaxID=472368 RepID=A0A2Z7AKQ3_9LAMI|nr:Cysteine-rich receptor-like protein kinase [Dorcoceras hygrometricum]